VIVFPSGSPHLRPTVGAACDIRFLEQLSRIHIKQLKQKAAADPALGSQIVLRSQIYVIYVCAPNIPPLYQRKS